jgi:hypothetical protein
VIKINLRRNIIGNGAKAPPEGGTRDRWRALVRLYRRAPGGVRVLAPKLHIPGYCATPDRYSTACVSLGANHRYGPVRWYSVDALPLPLCALCYRALTEDARQYLFPDGAPKSSRPPRCSRCHHVGHSARKCHAAVEASC